MSPYTFAIAPRCVVLLLPVVLAEHKASDVGSILDPGYRFVAGLSSTRGDAACRVEREQR